MFSMTWLALSYNEQKYRQVSPIGENLKLRKYNKVHKAYIQTWKGVFVFKFKKICNNCDDKLHRIRY